MKCNVYCDESGYLTQTENSHVAIGMLFCPEEEKKRIVEDIRNLKEAHGLNRFFEIKWTKVSASKVDFYLDLLRYIRHDPSLSFNGVAVPTQEPQDACAAYNNQDELCLKVYRKILEKKNPEDEFRMFLRKKDTRGGQRIQWLKKELCSEDFKGGKVSSINQISSRESEILQLADFICGAYNYWNNTKLYQQTKGKKGKAQIVAELFESVDNDEE